MSNGRKKCKVCKEWYEGQCCVEIDVPAPTVKDVQLPLKVQQKMLDEAISDNEELLQRLQDNPSRVTYTANVTYAAACKEDSPGLKYDAGKPDLTIIPVEALNSIATCLEYGAQKYARDNFKKGMRWSRLMAALLRHAYAYASGQKLDPESGLSHLSHVGACICMLLYFETTGAGTNDLIKE